MTRTVSVPFFALPRRGRDGHATAATAPSLAEAASAGRPRTLGAPQKETSTNRTAHHGPREARGGGPARGSARPEACAPRRRRGSEGRRAAERDCRHLRGRAASAIRAEGRGLPSVRQPGPTGAGGTHARGAASADRRRRSGADRAFARAPHADPRLPLPPCAPSAAEPSGGDPPRERRARGSAVERPPFREGHARAGDRKPRRAAAVSHRRVRRAVPPVRARGAVRRRSGARRVHLERDQHLRAPSGSRPLAQQHAGDVVQGQGREAERDQRGLPGDLLPRPARAARRAALQG